MHAIHTGARNRVAVLEWPNLCHWPRSRVPDRPQCLGRRRNDDVHNPSCGPGPWPVEGPSRKEVFLAGYFSFFDACAAGFPEMTRTTQCRQPRLEKELRLTGLRGLGLFGGAPTYAGSSLMRCSRLAVRRGASDHEDGAIPGCWSAEGNLARNSTPSTTP